MGNLPGKDFCRNQHRKLQLPVKGRVRGTRRPTAEAIAIPHESVALSGDPAAVIGHFAAAAQEPVYRFVGLADVGWDGPDAGQGMLQPGHQRPEDAQCLLAEDDPVLYGGDRVVTRCALLLGAGGHGVGGGERGHGLGPQTLRGAQSRDDLVFSVDQGAGELAFSGEPGLVRAVRLQEALGQGEAVVSAASAATLRHGAGRTDQGALGSPRQDGERAGWPPVSLWVNDQSVSSDVYIFLAGVAGAAITGAATLWGVRMAAQRSAKAQQAERRLHAYADLLVAAGTVLSTYRQIQDALSPDFAKPAADEANARMASLALTLHQASAVVALTGTELGRKQGHDLYQAAREVAASRMEPTSDPNYPWHMSGKDDKALDAAIEDYKAALVPETTALP
jgi:hypothetical protein